jgi:hypothetical protein
MRVPVVHDGRRQDLPDHLESHLRDWVDHELLTASESDLITAYEVSRVPSRKIPLAAEMVGYLGAVLVLAAGAVVYGNGFEELGHAWQVAVPALAGLAALAAGIPLVRHAEPTFRRLAGVLWTMSVGLVAFALAIALQDTSIPDEHIALLVGGSTLAYAAVLYSLTMHGGLQAAMLAAAIATGVGAIVWGGGGDPGESPVTYAVLMLAVGLAWVAAGAFDRLRPPGEAMLLGSAIALIGPIFLMPDWTGLGLVAGIVLAASLLTLSTWVVSTPSLLVSGVALFGYLVAAINTYLADTLGVPVAMALSGLVLIGVAIVVSRLRRFSRERPRAEAPRDRIDD